MKDKKYFRGKEEDSRFAVLRVIPKAEHWHYERPSLSLILGH
jgi:hypothetical protein